MAGSPSNPTRRVIAVLDFLAQHPLRTFTLTELAQGVGISKSTLHALVETLVEAGYLLRENESKQFRLGPVLAGIGTAALGRRGHLIGVLRPAMEKVAAELNSHCVVSADFDNWIVPLAHAGDPTHVTTLFRVGARANPFTPPMGVLFLPGRPMADIQEWLSRAQPPLLPNEIELNLSALEHLRSAGFLATARLDVKARMERAFDGLDSSFRTEDPVLVQEMIAEMRRSRYLILDYRQPEPQDVDWIGIPLLDDAGRVELAFVVLNLPRKLTGPDILDVARRMRESIVNLSGVRTLDAPSSRT
ncbi:helix-turn-helix domain-containing protein [Cryptosporangium sp. NPDC051539]|uniref:helix-turn-helix domain-containing protein n=1 Tax=Cryptosporangium sp. NPDC051539 TaxID=3363962 RepID=UPI0037BA4AE9